MNSGLYLNIVDLHLIQFAISTLAYLVFKKDMRTSLKYKFWLSGTQIACVLLFHCSTSQPAVGGLIGNPVDNLPFDPFHPQVSEWSHIDFFFLNIAWEVDPSSNMRMG